MDATRLTKYYFFIKRNSSSNIIKKKNNEQKKKLANLLEIVVLFYLQNRKADFLFCTRKIKFYFNTFVYVVKSVELSAGRNLTLIIAVRSDIKMSLYKLIKVNYEHERYALV